VFYVAAAIAGITATTSVPTLVAASPADFRATTTTEPWLSSLGYVAGSQQQTADDVGPFLSTFLKPGQEIYDFSNQPGLYFYILDYRPATRHFFTGTDLDLGSQNETVADLESNRPEFVIMYGSGDGALPAWDGISNAVRDYAISQYLLDHYKPFADVDGQVIYVRDDSTATVPPSLSSALGSQLSVTDLPFQYAGATWSDFHWIQLTVASGSPGASFTLADQEVAGENHDITFQSLPGGQTYRFPIDACPQWHGYSLPTLGLSLSGSVAVTVTQIKLLP
jgi:hypothetical protein